ncbi:MAG TPA: gamma-glutamyltransferase, partial [Dehalococcoidia bacterium]|nr:gamma-glutamyltransferase [Dehalococcoidia bacterium]
MPDVDSLQARGPVLGTHGMVASEHPLVSQTGVDVLRRGGNAFDAAMAMSAVLPIVKPGRSHLGGDAYILVYPRGEARVTAICSGGCAPQAATLDAYAGGMPARGGKTVAVPGLVDAWQVFSDRWCSMPLPDLLAPAVGYARDGFPVSRELELLLRGTQGMFTKYTGLAQMLYVDGAPPRMGQVLRQPALADTLDAIADGGRAAFY